MSVYQVLALGGLFAGAATVGAVNLTAPSQVGGCAENYEIQKGDTLLDIAREQLGTVFAVQFLIDENPRAVGNDPDLIFAGDTLRIPCIQAVSGQLAWSVMPDANGLAAMLFDQQVQVLDIRSHSDIANGLVPGSVHVPFDVFFAQGEAIAPSEAALEEILGLSGLRIDQPVVIVNNKPSEADLSQSSAVFNLLVSVGAPNVAILEDGYRGWIDDGLPVVAFPLLKDPYDANVQYNLSYAPDMIDIEAAESPYWQAAVQSDTVSAGGSLVLARWADQ